MSTSTKSNEERLLNLAVSLGYCLQVNGAEIYRVEEAICRLLEAYNTIGDVFAVPNSIMVTICPENKHPMTRIRRVSVSGPDIESIEVFYALGRRLCREIPDLETAERLLSEAKKSIRKHSKPVTYLGYFLAADAFAVYFGGTIPDGFFAGCCGMCVGFFLRSLAMLKVNGFIKTLVCAFVLAAFCQSLTFLDLIKYSDASAIGALMLLVPGTSFTDSMRDILYGDTFSGINRLVQVALTAAALLLGTGFALWVFDAVFGSASLGSSPIYHSPHLQVLAAAVACSGFCLLYNLRGFGIFVCMSGGGLCWVSYLIAQNFSSSVLLCNFVAAMSVSLYAEVMARVRKFPAFSYLIIAMLPIVPGAGVYYTVEYMLGDDMSASLNKGVQTIAVAGIIAVGVLIVSSIFRMINVAKRGKAESKRAV